MTAEDLSSLAAQLLENLLEDVQKCTTREDHIRVTARANEAHRLLYGINQMFYASENDEEKEERNTDALSNGSD